MRKIWRERERKTIINKRPSYRFMRCQFVLFLRCFYLLSIKSWSILTFTYIFKSFFHHHLFCFFLSFLLFAVLEKYVKPAEFLYDRVIRVWVLIFPFFAVTHPEDLQTILSSRKHTEKIFFYKLLHNFLGNGLITSSGICYSACIFDVPLPHSLSDWVQCNHLRQKRKQKSRLKTVQ